MSISLPSQISYNIQLFNNCSELAEKRRELDSAVFKIQSNTFPAKRLFRGLTEDIIVLVDLILRQIVSTIIPPTSIAGYDAGTVSLSDYASQDSLELYSDLLKLKSTIHLMQSAIIDLTDEEEIDSTPPEVNDAGLSKIVADRIDSETYDSGVGGYNRPVTESKRNYRLYRVQSNDTLMSIAIKFFGDYSMWTEIARINGIQNTSIMESSYVGKSIRIPLENVQMKDLSNLVYETFSDSNVDKYLYGRDLYLFDGKMLVSDTMDLKTTDGVDCVIDNLRDRLNYARGTLNPMHIAWGKTLLQTYGRTPYLVAVDRMIQDLLSQVRQDPRVVAASYDRKSIKIVGDRVDVSMEIKLKGGNTSSIGVTV